MGTHTAAKKGAKTMRHTMQLERDVEDIVPSHTHTVPKKKKKGQSKQKKKEAKWLLARMPPPQFFFIIIIPPLSLHAAHVYASLMPPTTSHSHDIS
jgi:hypothetical protein